MRSLLRMGKIVALGVIGLVVLAVGGLSGVRAVRQQANEKAFAIHTPDGIDEAGYVTLGGIPHWVQIRGTDRANPVLLCLHGGPGGTWIPVTRLFLPWERHFTVVQWDQRGAGKTLKASGPAIAATMSVETMTRDGLELAEHLRARLGKEKIILLGHSWGSILGTNMVRRRPELFHAYVGTGQVSDLPRSLKLEYERLLEQARAAKDVTTLRKLAEIGPPPFTNARQAAVFFDRSSVYQPQSDGVAMDELKRSLLSPPPGYSLRDEVNRFRGFAAVPPWRLYEEMLNTRLGEIGTEFRVPIFFIQGNEDRVTPAALARAYLDGIEAPHKELVLLEGGGHFAVWSMAERFADELVMRVRPRALLR
jgi:pimeloyl-ACP methyl ester carboxylesterase